MRERGDFCGFMKMIEAGLAKFANDRDLLMLRGSYYCRNREYSAALDDSRRMVEWQRFEPDGYVLRAEVFARGDKWLPAWLQYRWLQRKYGNYWAECKYDWWYCAQAARRYADARLEKLALRKFLRADGQYKSAFHRLQAEKRLKEMMRLH